MNESSFNFASECLDLSLYYCLELAQFGVIRAV